MDNKTVLVTGGSRGIGKAICKIFADNGYAVIAPTRSEMDLRSRESVKQFILTHPEGFDVIINNAGINEIHLVGELNESDYDDMVSINLTSPFMLINGFIGKMAERKYGRIVNIASIWSVVSKPGRSVYSSSKHGILGLTATVALEYSKYNVLCNSVSPGFTLTDLTRKNNTAQQIAEISKSIPIGRMAEVEEIASVVYFLASSNNTYITGQNIVVDGGYALQ